MNKIYKLVATFFSNKFTCDLVKWQTSDLLSRASANFSQVPFVAVLYAILASNVNVGVSFVSGSRRVLLLSPISNSKKKAILHFIHIYMPISCSCMWQI